jgi:hypothetical protein
VITILHVEKGDTTAAQFIEPRFVSPANSGLEFLPPARLLVVPPADRVGVNVCRYADRRVALAFGNSRDLHPRRQQVSWAGATAGRRDSGLFGSDALAPRWHASGLWHVSGRSRRTN